MSDNNKIGICMPYYNSSNYLDDAIKSLVNQSYGNGHLIVFNDGSTPEELLKLKQSLNKIQGKYTLIGNKHVGQFAARGAMGDIAKNGYIVNLDADDYFFDTNSLKLICECFINKKVDAVFYKYVRNKKQIKEIPYSQNANSVCILNKEKFQAKFCNSGLYNNIHSKAFTVNLLKKMICDKNLYLTFSEDRYETALLLDNAKSICIINNPIYYYRGNLSSITNSRYTFKMFDDEIFVEKQIEKFVNKGKIQNYDIDFHFQSIAYYNIYRIFMSDMAFNKKKMMAKNFKNKFIVKKILNEKLKDIFLPRKIILFLFKHNIIILVNFIFAIDKIFTRHAFFRDKLSKWEN